MTVLSITESPTRYRAYGVRDLTKIGQRYGLGEGLVQSIAIAARVLPFRVNQHVLENLIDWGNIPDDPMFQMLFPQAGMLEPQASAMLRSLAVRDWPEPETERAVAIVRRNLNPHPSGQMELNVPAHDGVSVAGIQHKYRETVLYFPAQGQTCHAYCSYCFRWAQFIGDADLKFSAPRPDRLIEYLSVHRQVTDVLITGGDPLLMGSDRLADHVDPLLSVPTVETIRFGTKALAYWPRRFLQDTDAGELLRLFQRIVISGRTCAVMAHFSHPRELDQPATREAVAKVLATGAQIFCQGPLIARVNDDADAWRSLWHHQLRLGAVPYYMFVERDTGPQEYFKVPLRRAVQIFQDAYRDLPGLARTVRGPVMSATPGKVAVDSVVATGQGHSRLQLRFLQARDPSVVGKAFTAECDSDASWLSDLTAFGGPADVLETLDRWGGASGKRVDR